MSFLAPLFYWLFRPFIRAQVVADQNLSDLKTDDSKPITYVLLTNSFSDKLALEQVCRREGLPSPFSKLKVGGVERARTISVKKVNSRLFKEENHFNKTLTWGQSMLEQVEKENLDVQLVPVMLVWGRDPGIEKAKDKTTLVDLISQTYQASPLRKLFIVLFSGHHNFVRISKPVSLQKTVNDFGSDEDAARKLLRIARIHFARQKLIATGPKIMQRYEFFNSMLASPALKKALQEEMASKKISQEQAKKNAIKLLDEIAGDYNESYIRLGSRVLTWLWNKIYSGIRVHNADELREYAQKGHEIVYVPCHRSHMDYLLLTYVIYHEGLVPPHIAAGINLNFWPAGHIFRKAGAFFMRRTFKGNKLYSAVFKEYLSQLFIKGYPVKYYTEGGRSRTGRLLTPKTGMLAMTVQAMLRGIDRPITLVPVYIGYEHVMEVNTYLKELKGQNKEGESALGVFKAIRNLKNYGHGDVNFGTPINLNDLITQQVPDWRDFISEEDTVKPSWLTPVVNHTAQSVMESINDAAVLNTVNLCALALLASENYALARSEIIQLIEFFITLQKDVSYSSKVKVPSQAAEQIVDEALLLKKVESESDEYGTIIKLDDKGAILMSYYRNNVVHLYAVASIVASAIVNASVDKVSDIKNMVKLVLPILKDEMFITLSDSDAYVEQLIEYFVTKNILVVDGDKIELSDRNGIGYLELNILSKLMKDTLQRYALGFNRIAHVDGIQRGELEKDCLKLAKRLLTLHDVKAPEYFDKKVISRFVTSIREHELVEIDQAGLMHLSQAGRESANVVDSLLSSEILQSLKNLG